MSETDKNLYCSFCSKTASEVKKLIAGSSVYICDECVNLCHSLLSSDVTCDKSQVATQNKSSSITIPNPTKIKEFLDQYIIGQDYAKMAISVAVNAHYKRIANPVIDGIEIDKSNLLIYGSSGTGKTYLAQSIARYLDVPFAMADATSLTEAGYVGDDVESIVAKLLQSAGGDVAKAERGIIYIDEIDKKHRKDGGGSTTRDVSGEGVQQALLKILEGSDVMVPSSGSKRNSQSDLVKVNTKNVLFIVAGAFVGLDKVVEKSLNKNTGLGFNGSLAKASSTSNDLMRQVRPEHLVQFGIIPELIGRLPIGVPMEELTIEHLVRILTEPKNAIVSQFIKLFQLEGIELIFEDGALNEVAKISKERKTGARGLRSVIENKLIKTQFNLINMKERGATKVVVTRETFTKDDEPLVVYGELLNTIK